MNEIRRAAVIGAGIMGHGIAQLFAQAGIPVCLTDSQPERLVEAHRQLAENLNLFVAHGLLSREKADEGVRLVTTGKFEEAARNADFVTECVTEDLPLKQDIFEELDRLTPAHAILASNTSSLPLSKVGTRVKDKSRLMVTHYFNPPYIVPIVEVVSGETTHHGITETTLALMRRLGKLPIHLKKAVPGFLVNRVQAAIVREVLSLVEQEVAAPEDIDKAVRGVIGFRLAALGPLEVMDFGGLDTWLAVARNLFPEISSRADAPALIADKVAQGDLGVKAGRGFYQWSGPGSSIRAVEKIQQRDEAFLNLLKLFYRERTS